MTWLGILHHVVVCAVCFGQWEEVETPEVLCASCFVVHEEHESVARSNPSWRQ